MLARIISFRLTLAQPDIIRTFSRKEDTSENKVINVTAIFTNKGLLPYDLVSVSCKVAGNKQTSVSTWTSSTVENTHTANTLLKYSVQAVKTHQVNSSSEAEGGSAAKS